MKKADREKIFNKYGGKCAYCGCDLVKGWHVDEIEPVRRNQKWIQGGWFHKGTGAQAKSGDITRDELAYEWKGGKWVADGMLHPERLTIKNQNPSCASCNINKHSMSLEEFRQLITGFMKYLNEANTQYKIAKRYGLVTETGNEVKFYFECLTSPIVGEEME